MRRLCLPPPAGKLLLFLPSLFCHASVSVPPLVRPAASRIVGSDARLRMLLLKWYWERNTTRKLMFTALVL